MIKSLSAALLAVSMLTAPAFAAGTDKTPAAPAAATATDAAKPAATPLAQTNVAPKAKSSASAHVARHHHRAVHHKLNKQSSLRGHSHVAKVGATAPAKQHLSKAQLRPAAPKRG